MQGEWSRKSRRKEVFGGRDIRLGHSSERGISGYFGFYGLEEGEFVRQDEVRTRGSSARGRLENSEKCAECDSFSYG